MCCSFFSAHTYNIGFCITATGRYIEFVKPLICSARKYFLKNHTVTFFVFTDGQISGHDIVVIPHRRLGWPYDTLMRFAVYDEHKELFAHQDYIFACDADMLFVASVGDEILGDRVGTQHPGFVGRRGTYETNSASTACVRANEGDIYFAGGFYGAKTSEFLALVQETTEHIREDLSCGMVAVWHDESHLNRYFIDHAPTVILSPSYCYPESWKLPYVKRLLALDKNHSEYRK